jgi:putative membrane protein
MTDTPDAPRKPRAFKLDAPGVKPPPKEAEPVDLGPEPASGAAAPKLGMPPGFSVDRGIRWGSILLAALSAAATLAVTIWFYRLVEVGLWRDDWIGWTMRGLIGIALLAVLMMLLREVVGLVRLGRLARLKAAVDAAVAKKDVKAERAAVDRIAALYASRAELRWPLQRLKEHARDVHDPGSLVAIADRDLMAEIDGAARRVITSSARRVATVTALSPMALISVGFVAFENLRVIRTLAALYGGRPGFAGMVGLARRIVTHLVATGGVALTDDLIGQFIGQDLMRRLSARLGEGAFNGALTARLGVAAIEIIRPLPFIEARPVRVRDVLAEALRPTGQEATAPADAEKTKRG